MSSTDQNLSVCVIAIMLKLNRWCSLDYNIICIILIVITVSCFLVMVCGFVSQPDCLPSADLSYTQFGRWGVWDPTHLPGPWFGPQRFRCGVTLWRAWRWWSSPRRPWQLCRARQRPVLCLNICKSSNTRAWAFEPYDPAGRRTDVGINSRNGEEKIWPSVLGVKQPLFDFVSKLPPTM